MTTPKILYRGSGDGAQRSSSRAARLRILLALPAVAAVAVALVAYSSGPTAAAAATRTLRQTPAVNVGEEPPQAARRAAEEPPLREPAHHVLAVDHAAILSFRVACPASPILQF